MENQLDSVPEKPTCFLRLQGLACDWSKHNKHSRNIFSVHGFLRLSVILRACLHGRRVTLLEGLPSLEGQKIAVLYMCRVIPGAVLPAKGAET